MHVPVHEVDAFGSEMKRGKSHLNNLIYNLLTRRIIDLIIVRVNYCFVPEENRKITTVQGCDRYKYFGSPNQIQNQIRLVLLVLVRYKDMILLWDNGKLCISKPDTGPNW